MPRFQGSNLDKNQAIVERVKEVAAAKRVTPAQLALAWVLAKGDDIVPIPGTKRRKYLDENAASADVALTPAEVAALDAAVPRDAAAGARYPDMSLVNR
jgi:aryl-alcohol dehydrogenase-like predicted oxidoreductase